MTVFNVCVHDTAQLLYISINFLVEDLLVNSFDWSVDSTLLWLLFVSVLQWKKN